MREKEEILGDIQEVNEAYKNAPAWTSFPIFLPALIETLIDIRDILKEAKE